MEHLMMILFLKPQHKPFMMSLFPLPCPPSQFKTPSSRSYCEQLLEQITLSHTPVPLHLLSHPPEVLFSALNLYLVNPYLFLNTQV